MLPNRSVLEWPTGTTVYKPDKCYNGYTVVNPYRSNQIYLVDMAGRIVHVWNADSKKIAESWFLRLLPNGNWLSLSYSVPRGKAASSLELWPTCFSAADFDTEVVEMDWDGEVVWRYTAPRHIRVNHDMARLANGNTVILMEVAANIPSISPKVYAENFFIEVDPAGKTVWEWRLADHFEELEFSAEARRLIAARGLDCIHTNTVSPLPGNDLEKTDSRFARGNILTSQRDTNLIFIIDKKTGKVVWKWGTGEGQLVGQHHPVMLGNGNILIYDNGGQAGYPLKVRFSTRLVEVNPISNQIVWQYAYDPYVFKPSCKFFSPTWGSVQRLPNGNTFSLDCHRGRLFEVTPSGEIVWEYVSPFAWGRGTRVLESGIYRAYRYGYDEAPRVDPIFPNTDGHVGVAPALAPLPPALGSLRPTRRRALTDWRKAGVWEPPHQEKLT